MRHLIMMKNYRSEKKGIVIGITMVLVSLILFFSAAGYDTHDISVLPPGRIYSGLEKKTGVRAADVSFKDSQARILHDPERVAENQLVEAIEKAGYCVAGKP